MADDVQIKFGAEIDDALDAIERLKQAISALAEPVSRNQAAFRQSSIDFAQSQREMTSAQQQASARLAALGETNAAAQQRIDQSYIQSFKRDMQVLVDEKKITIQQALGFDIEYTAQLAGLERERLGAILSSDAATATDKATTYRELLQLEQRYATQVEEEQKKLADAARAQAEKVQRSYERAFDQLGRSAQTTFNQVLTGQTTWQSGSIRLLQAFETFFLEEIETIAAKWAALGLSDLAGGAVATAVTGAQATGATGLGAGLMALVGINQPSGLFGTGLLSGTGGAAAIAQTTAVTANTTAVTALTAAVGGLTAAVGGTGAVVAAGGTAGLAVGGADVAGAAAGAGLGAGGLGGLFDVLAFAKGGVVPSAAGGWALPSFSGATPALLHGREMVLPADISQGLQEMIGGGRAMDTHVHIHAIDSRSGAQFVMAQAHNIARALQRAQRGFNPATMTR